MITPIKALTINQICNRNEDLLVSKDDIHQLAQNVRKQAIDEFAKQLHELCGTEIGDYQYPDLLHESRIDEIAEKLKNRKD